MPWRFRRVIVALGLAVLTGCANQDAKMTPGEGPKPFTRALPETHEYVRLLAKPDAVVLHSGLVTLAPGADCGWHSTEGYEEMIICLVGAGEVETESNGRRPLAAGQYAYNPPHLRHCVFNTGTEPMRYIYVVAPTEPKKRP